MLTKERKDQVERKIVEMVLDGLERNLHAVDELPITSRCKRQEPESDTHAALLYHVTPEQDVASEGWHCEYPIPVSREALHDSDRLHSASDPL